MRFRDLKISTRLIGGFIAMLVLVIALGVVSYRQANMIFQQTETIYNHPLQVRKAIGKLEVDILKMRLGTRDLMLASTDAEKQMAIQFIELSGYDAQKQFKILDIQYLGPPSDIEEAQKAFYLWNSARQENIKLAAAGEIEQVKEKVKPTSTIGILRDNMLARIKTIDDYASRKVDSLFAESIYLKKALNTQLALLVIAIILIAFAINYYFIRSIRMPIMELTHAAQSFRDGKMDARSKLNSKNEFGVLARSFNDLVESIQINADLSERASSLVGSMLIEENATKFFHAIFPTLSAHTNSQIAAVYLLSEDKKTFEYFESIGMDNKLKKSFDVESFEGEFGAVLASHKIEIVKNIPKDTVYVYQTVSGEIVPREIISIPILSGNEVIAVISLASVRKYSPHSIQLIENIYYTLNARIEGVLAFRKMKSFSEKLEIQNIRLETQKTELEAQSAVLNEQNRELEMQKNELNEATRLKSSFLSNMSHELRTPLNSVIALTGVLNRRLATKIPPDEYGYLEVIERNGKHLLSLINDILDISRIEAGYAEIEISRFSPHNLIAEIVTMIHPQAELKNIELLHKAGDKNILVVSDIDKCRHILQNLIANAVKFTPKGKVEITAQQKDDTINITVTDTGIGISRKHIAHIFDEFRQADGSTSRRYGGTGLGLAIAKKYANLLGGTVTVQSKEDQGSAFTLTLPLKYNAKTAISEAENKPAREIPTQIPSLNAKVWNNNILLVEDSEPAIIQLKDFLEGSGYTIWVARNGEEALSIISQKIPDAIILDLMMPVVDGFEVLKTIREAELTAHIPVLILTAKQITKEELKVLKRNNIHQLIQKGDVNREELLSSLASLVPPRKVEPEKPEREIQPIHGKPIVLVVEDNPDNMITVKAILSDNFTIIEAMDGKQGVLLAQKHTPHIILMDISLPGMNGIEAFKAIRKISLLAHIPIIALTASAMNSDREKIVSSGFDAYIPKPIEENVFFQTINKVLYGR